MQTLHKIRETHDKDMLQFQNYTIQSDNLGS